MSKSASPPEDDENEFDDQTRESLEYCAERYDGVVGAAAEMLLQDSEEGSNE